MTSNSDSHAWRQTMLGEITRDVSERVSNSGEAPRIYGVERGTGLTPTPKYVGKDLSRYKKIMPGMFAYNPMRLNIGSLGFCSPKHQPGAVSPDYVVFQCEPSLLDPLYMYYVTQSSQWNEWVSGAGVGSVRVRIYYSELARMPLLVPPMDEQRAIAAVLGALDDKIEQNRRTSQSLEELARAMFKAWFVDFEPVKAKAAGQTSFPGMSPTFFAALTDHLTDSPLGPVPQGWAVRALSQVCRIVSGGTPKRSEAAYWGGDIPWYSIKDAPPDGEPWVYFTDEYISQAGLEGSAATLVPVGCTIISARGTVGRLGLVARPMAFNQSCYGLLPSDEASYRHLYLLLREVVDELKQRSHGSVFDTITRQTFDTVNVVFPPTEVLAEFENVTAPWFDLLLTLSNESSKLSELRNYLLPRLLSGTIRVKTRYV